MFHAENFTQQGKPKLLTFTLFITFALPVFCKVLCRCPLLYIVHIRTAFESVIFTH